jgi:transmembrane 9 superfamily protein 2/4
MILPPTMFYTNKYFAIAIGGVLPFGAVFIELFFIISSVWQHQYCRWCAFHVTPFRVAR